VWKPKQMRCLLWFLSSQYGFDALFCYASELIAVGWAGDAPRQFREKIKVYGKKC